MENVSAKRKRRLFLLLGLLLAVGVAVGVYQYQHTFTTAKWLDAPAERVRIVDDLLAGHALVGMTEAEITALLGSDNSDRGYFAAPDRLVYYLGDERGWISIDSEWLLVEIADGVVDSYSITTD